MYSLYNISFRPKFRAAIIPRRPPAQSIRRRPHVPRRPKGRKIETSASLKHPRTVRSHPFLAAGSTHRLYLPSLDGARGIAIFLVLLDHLSSAKIIPFHSLRGIGLVGVYLFFSLSAFLLTVPFWLRSKESLTEWNTWSTYLWRRFFRIYPLYILVLLAKHWTDAAFTWGFIGEHLLLRRGDGIYWTIEVETQYYIVLPLMVLTFFLSWRRNAVAGILCSIGFYLLLHLVFHAEGKWWSLDGRVLRDYFWVFFSGSAAGSLFALSVSRPIPSRRVRWVWEAAAIGSLAIISFALPDTFAMLPAVLRLPGNGMTLLAGVAWSVFIFAHLHGIGLVKKLLEWRPLRYLGLISYSLYLLHKQVMRGSGWLKGIDIIPQSHFSWIIKSVCLMAVAVAAASVSFFLIERPLSRLKAGYTRSI